MTTKRRPKAKCLGCDTEFYLQRGTSRPICLSCRSDPKRRSAAVWKHEMNRLQKRIDDEAENDTRNLPREDAYNPLVGNRLVEKMIRGEW